VVGGCPQGGPQVYWVESKNGCFDSRKVEGKLHDVMRGLRGREEGGHTGPR